LFTVVNIFGLMLKLFKPTSKPDFVRTSIEVNSMQFIDQF